MEIVPVDPLDVGSMLDSQRDLFHHQIDQFHDIVVAQCRLTGVNPLSQEMAAGALSINIGKRPRDLLNPKAIKHLQSVFSIKDLIGKKESREISALCGVTLTQVREYFAGQRSRVRKSIRLSREKAIKTNEPKPIDNCSPSDSKTLIENSESVSASFGEGKIGEEPTGALVDFVSCNGDRVGDHGLPGSTMDKNSENTTLSQEEVIPDINPEDKKFLETIFTLMRKEQSFSGQAKLMEWILQINNSAILYWFLTKGGATILASWLSQSAAEEQTSIILVIFKVLCHLPLYKAQPAHLSSILQIVNKLRFYRMSDISNKARILLSRWSKILIRIQAVKKSTTPLKPNGGDKELFRQWRINEILSDGTWQTTIHIPEEIHAVTNGSTESGMQLESKQVLRLLPAACDGSSKKSGRIVSTMKMKERRKVLLVEQPDHASSSRNTLASRVVSTNLSRPLSADDIQKAKMRAFFMQSKHGKTDAVNSEKNCQNIGDKKLSPLKLKTPTGAPSESKGDEVRKSRGMNATSPSIGTLNNSKPGGIFQNPLLEKLRNFQIPWQKPPEMKIDASWRLGSGENSKEVDIQSARNKREQEASYPSNEIPENPKDPWDLEMDFDDSLTPEIPTEQLSDDDEDETGPATDCTGSGEVESCPVPENPSIASSTVHGSIGSSMPFTSPTDPASTGLAGMVNSMPFISQVENVSMGGKSLPSPTLDKNIPMVASYTGNSVPFTSHMDNAKVGTSMPFPMQTNTISTSTSATICTPTPPPDGNKALLPDLELLAVLLKNPDLVFALTSGQANGITDAQMVALLDMLKGGGMQNGVLNQSTGNRVEKPEMTRLPSPTPPATVPGEWKQEHKVAATHSIPSPHLPGIHRNPPISYVGDARASSHYSTDVQRDAFRSALPSSQSVTPISLASSSDLPIHWSSTNSFVHLEPSPTMQQANVRIAAMGHDPTQPTMPIRSPNIVASSSPTLPHTSIAMGSLRESSDYRFTKLSDDKDVRRPPVEPFYTSRSETNRPSPSREFSRIGAPLPRELPSTAVRVPASSPPVPSRLPNSSMDVATNHNRTRFPMHETSYDYERNSFPYRSSRSTFRGSPTMGSNDDQVDGWRLDKDEDMRPPDYHVDDFKARPGRIESDWENQRRNWSHDRRDSYDNWSHDRRDGYDRRGGYDRHSPAKRRWRDRDRRY